MNILVLTFCYEPDLTAGSYKNSALVKGLLKEGGDNVNVDVITTQPNKFFSYEVKAPAYEEKKNLKIWRIPVPPHHTGFLDRIWSYKTYYLETQKILKKQKTRYDVVYASTSRLFTGYLGARIAKKQKTTLYLDIRDIFVDSIKDVIKNKWIKLFLIPALKTIEKYTIKRANHINLVSGGFVNYFKKYYKGTISTYTNGVDEIFYEYDFSKSEPDESQPKIITYAGNMGEGQGLEKIIPNIASRTNGKYLFKMIGGGGRKQPLIDKIKELNVTNVIFVEPVSREKLLAYYKDSDFLFLHLNDYPAFEKVLPSKIFEYAATGKPIIAGISGFSKSFMEQEVDNVIFFEQCNDEDLNEKLDHYAYKAHPRTDFLKKYRRTTLISKMANSILNHDKKLHLPNNNS